MRYIEGDTANELFINASKALIKYGKKSSPRGMETIEIRDAWLTLKNPKECVVTLDERKIDYEYLQAELDWYINGDPKIHEISKKASMWGKIKNTNDTANSNYGKLALVDVYNGKSQLEWVIDCIKKDSDTRQAVINYNQPQHKYESNKDFPCTLTQSFRVNEDRIDTNVVMRSNDMIYGLTYDMPWFSWVLNEVCEKTGYKMGEYHHLAHSFHVYDRHFKMLDDLAKIKKNVPKSNFKREQNIERFIKER